VEHSILVHCVDGYVAVKQPALGKRCCVINECQESNDETVPAEFAAPPADGSDGVAFEHAARTADKTAIDVSRKRIIACTFR
jgi:hypothetical protein